MPVLKFNQCDYDCHGKKDKRGSFRIYCGKVDKTCSQGSTNGKVGVSLPVPSKIVSCPFRQPIPKVMSERTKIGLFPMPPLPPYDTRPKRFYSERKYIGINFRKEEHGEWIDSLIINKFQGHPYNKYDFKIIVEYNNDLWNHLIQRIKSEAAVYNREAVIKDDYAYTVAKIISTPKTTVARPASATETPWDAVIDVRTGTLIERIVDAKTLKTIPINRIKGLRVAVWNSIEATQILNRGGIPIDRGTKKPWIKVGKDVLLETRPISVAPTATPLTAVEQDVLSVMANTPMHIDEIVIAAQLPTGKVSSTLLTLELKDLIKRLPGAYFVRK